MVTFESSNSEFKREYSSNIKKEVVAFLNSQGGKLYLGVSDDGSVTGLDDPDSTCLQLVNMIQNSIKPDASMFVDCRLEEHDNTIIVVADIQRGTDRPYYLTEKGLKPSGVYVRMHSASVPASDEAIRAMIKKTDGYSYEKERSLEQQLTFSDAKVEFEKRNIEFGESQMRTLDLINEDGLYTNLALLLSDQCRHTIKVAVFQGTSKEEFKDRHEFTGSLLRQLNDAYTYIDLHNKTRSLIEGLLRIDKKDYPEVAIREALINAIIHREYSFSGSTIVNIYDDRIEFASLGGLLHGLSLDGIKLGVSQSRNEHLANVFYRLRLIEAYGTGIAKIIESYTEYPQKPDFMTADGAFLVSLPNRNYKSDTREAVSSSPQIAQDLPVAGSVNERVIAYLGEQDSVSRKDVEEFLGIKQTAAGNILHELVEKGLIKQVGKGRNTHYQLV